MIYKKDNMEYRFKFFKEMQNIKNEDIKNEDWCGMKI